MGRGGAQAGVDGTGIAIAAGLLALVLPAASFVLLALAGAGQIVASDASMRRKTLFALAGCAIGGMVFGPPGVVAMALVWRTHSEVARTRETQGLTEPWWMAVAYRWAPAAAALLYRLGAPDLFVACSGAIAAIALCDWAMRRLAEWRLGDPQPFDTQAYLAHQGRLALLLLVFPEPLAALAALSALAMARKVGAPTSARYAAA